MGRSKETFNKKEVKKRKEKKRKDKEKKRLEKKDSDKKGGLDDMIAYVDEFGRITSTPPEHEKEEVKAEDIEISVPPKGEEPEEDRIRTGKVTFFNDSKGYGFIQDAATSERVFVHVNNCLVEIQEGLRVSYEVEMGKQGPSAIQVKNLQE
jgi:cold shock CspA family protein